MYAALVISAALAAGDHLHEFPGSAFARGASALALAFAIVRAEPRLDRWVAVFVAWFGLFGAIAIAGPLWQRYVPTSDELRIYIDVVFFGVAVASEVLLLLCGLLLLAIRRGAP
jgi:hypothetical protein